jgi:predicted nucleic acid-binding protein
VKFIVDSSVWIAHLHKSIPRLVEIIDAGDVLTHPAVIGELSCGNFRHRASILADIRRLPRAEEGRFEEVLQMIEAQKLYGKGLGWVDCQLLASASLSSVGIFTQDRALAKAASGLGIPT